MATHNVFILGIFLVVLVLLTTVHAKRINRQQLRPTRGFQEMELAVTRGFGKRAIDMPVFDKEKSLADYHSEWVDRQHRAFSDMPITSARNYGKRALDLPVFDKEKEDQAEWVKRQHDTYRAMPVMASHGYGKRAVDMHLLKNFLLEWFALEAKLRSLRMAQDRNELLPMDE